MDLLPRLIFPTTTTTAETATETEMSSPATSTSASSSATTSPTSRAYDLIFVGASGFVGKLATMQLLKRYGSDPSAAGFSWALSARNEARLKQVHEEILEELKEWQQEQQQEQAKGQKGQTKIQSEEAKEEKKEEKKTAPHHQTATTHATLMENRLRNIDVMYGDVDDPSFARSLAKKTKVIAASLTPYSLHGSRLVEACVAEGTHYVDISGEMLWIKENIDKYHEEAKEKGVRIVHACGLGSVPADLSVHLMLHRLHEEHVHVKEVKFMMGPVYSSLGGGSMTSYATLIKTGREQGKIMQMLDPHLLTPPKLRENTHEVNITPKTFGMGFDLDLRRFTAPLWLAALDDQVVARSAALLGYPSFRYVEAQTYSFSLFGLVSAFLTWIASFAFAGLLYMGPTRWLLTKVRPPGSGPNRLIREKGHGTAYVVGKGTTQGGGKVTYVGEFDMPQGDPGYMETSKMLVESALCLVLDMDKLPQPQHRGGVLTPAAAFGQVLMDRLHRASGMSFKM